tara:strand:+ start:725 stop:1045 length:321 start_codon:yes stop_codon:yes gene_type:complete
LEIFESANTSKSHFYFHENNFARTFSREREREQECERARTLAPTSRRPLDQKYVPSIPAIINSTFTTKNPTNFATPMLQQMGTNSGSQLKKKRSDLTGTREERDVL